MREILKQYHAARMIGALCLAVLAGTLVMIGAYLLPTAPIAKHVGQSVGIYETEGVYPGWAPSKHSTDLDNFTDTLMLQNAMFSGEGNAVWKAMTNPRSVWAGKQLWEQLAAGAEGVPADAVSTYPRYWHGYLALLKPALSVVNVSYLRVLNLDVQLLLAAYLIYLLGRRLGVRYGVAFLLAYLLWNPASLAMSFQFYSVYYISVLMTILAVRRYAHWAQENRYVMLFLLAGILTSFFDLLTYPLASLGIPLTAFLLMRYEDGGLRKMADGWRLLFASGVAWVLGYCGMYSGKWLVAWLLTGVNVPANAMHQALFYTETAYEGVSIHAPYIWFRNFIIPLHEPLGLALVLLGLACCAVIWRRRRRIAWTGKRVACWMLGVVALYPFVWYAVLTKHSYVHAWFTFRELGIAVFALASLVFVVFERERE